MIILSLTKDIESIASAHNTTQSDYCNMLYLIIANSMSHFMKKSISQLMYQTTNTGAL